MVPELSQGSLISTYQKSKFEGDEVIVDHFKLKNSKGGWNHKRTIQAWKYEISLGK